MINDKEVNCTRYTFHIKHIDTNKTIVSLPLYEGRKYDELMEKGIGGNIEIQPHIQGMIQILSLSKGSKRYWTWKE